MQTSIPSRGGAKWEQPFFTYNGAKQRKLPNRVMQIAKYYGNDYNAVFFEKVHMYSPPLVYANC